MLAQERSERMSLENAATSLQNALQTSRQKVNEQKETISRLEDDVQKAQSVAPCLREIINGSFVDKPFQSRYFRLFLFSNVLADI